MFSNHFIININSNMELRGQTTTIALYQATHALDEARGNLAKANREGAPWHMIRNLTDLVETRAMNIIQLERSLLRHQTTWADVNYLNKLEAKYIAELDYINLAKARAITIYQDYIDVTWIIIKRYDELSIIKSNGYLESKLVPGGNYTYWDYFTKDGFVVPNEEDWQYIYEKLPWNTLEEKACNFICILNGSLEGHSGRWLRQGRLFWCYATLNTWKRGIMDEFFTTVLIVSAAEFGLHKNYLTAPEHCSIRLFKKEQINH